MEKEKWGINMINDPTNLWHLIFGNINDFDMPLKIIQERPHSDMSYSELLSISQGNRLYFDKIFEGKYKRYFGYPTTDLMVFVIKKYPENKSDIESDMLVCGYRFENEFKSFERCKSCNSFECDNVLVKRHTYV